MAETGRTRNRLWIWLLMVLVVAGGLTYYGLSSSRDRVAIKIATVDRAPILKQVSTNGRVEPLVDFQAHSPAASTVEELGIHLGQQVARGQQLFKLDASEVQLRIANANNQLTVNSQELRNLQNGGTHDELLGENADLRNAQAQYQSAVNNMSAMKALQAQGAASENEVTAAQQRLSDTKARVDQVQTRLKQRYGSVDFSLNQSQRQRDQDELAAAKNSLAGMDVRSPIAGTVYSLPIARYDYVQPGQALVGVADLHKLQVRAYFDEPEIGSLSAGEAVKIVWDAKPDRTWHGHVTQAPTTVITVGTRNVGECLISVEDADGDLLPNTNVTVTVTTQQHLDVLSLPREALHTRGTENSVYRVVDGKLVLTPVSVGLVTLTRVEVTRGLNAGDAVALGAANSDIELQNGLQVRTQP